MARVLSKTFVTPVQVTLVSASLLVGGAVAFGLRSYLLGAILTLAGAVTDCIDGDLARVRGSSSRRGAFLDSVLDRWTDGATILGLWYSAPGRLGGIAGLAILASLLTSYTRARAQSLGTDVPDGIGGRDARLLAIVAAVLLGEIFIGLAVVAVIGFITSAHRMIIANGRLARLDREGR
jgi:phosphatidylglycerophosphate synthase